jgi:hypothetical protein
MSNSTFKKIVLCGAPLLAAFLVDLYHGPFYSMMCAFATVTLMPLIVKPAPEAYVGGFCAVLYACYCLNR